MTYYSFDRIEGNSVYTHSFIEAIENFTEEEQVKLFNGEEIQDRYGDWIALSEEDKED